MGNHFYTSILCVLDRVPCTPEYTPGYPGIKYGFADHAQIYMYPGASREYTLLQGIIYTLGDPGTKPVMLIIPGYVPGTSRVCTLGQGIIYTPGYPGNNPVFVNHTRSCTRVYPEYIPYCRENFIPWGYPGNNPGSVDHTRVYTRIHPEYVPY